MPNEYCGGPTLPIHLGCPSVRTLPCVEYVVAVVFSNIVFGVTWISRWCGYAGSCVRKWDGFCTIEFWHQILCVNCQRCVCASWPISPICVILILLRAEILQDWREEWWFLLFTNSGNVIYIFMDTRFLQDWQRRGLQKLQDSSNFTGVDCFCPLITIETLFWNRCFLRKGISTCSLQQSLSLSLNKFVCMAAFSCSNFAIRALKFDISRSVRASSLAPLQWKQWLWPLLILAPFSRYTNGVL